MIKYCYLSDSCSSDWLYHWSHIFVNSIIVLLENKKFTQSVSVLKDRGPIIK